MVCPQRIGVLLVQKNDNSTESNVKIHFVYTDYLDTEVELTLEQTADLADKLRVMVHLK